MNKKTNLNERNNFFWISGNIQNIRRKKKVVTKLKTGSKKPVPITGFNDF
jgi:hypothetical protein